LCRNSLNSTNQSITPFRYVATIPQNGKLSARKTAKILEFQRHRANLVLDVRRESPRVRRAWLLS